MVVLAGESWSFATWEDGYPTDSGDGLVAVPGKGWRDADPSETASGFIANNGLIGGFSGFTLWFCTWCAERRPAALAFVASRR